MSTNESTAIETASAQSERTRVMDRLLTVQNAKTTKGEKLGILTGILYLAPANESGVMNTCASSTPECRQACLYTAGRGRFDSVRYGRIRKTRWLARDRESFVEELKLNVTRLVTRACKLRLQPAIRVNGTSDLPWLAQELATAFPEVQFYDYTKHPKPWLRTLPNYHLTFSHSGRNVQDCMESLQHGINVAVVFTTRRGESLPQTWNGFPVIDGDLHDCRFLEPKGVVVGLRAKGMAKGSQSPFVVLVA
jgi:hypothetical protein